jgi:CRP-like cAMP-binding protein
VVLEVTRDLLVGLGARFPGLEEILQRFYRERLLANLLRSSPLFSSFAEPALLALADRFALRKAAAEELLVKEGEPGEALFVLLRGRCEPFHEGADGQRHPYPTMVEGAVFGEIALLRDGRASASVRAATDCLLLALDRESFRSQVLANEDARKKLEALRDQRLQRTVELLLQLGPEYAAWV